MGRNNLRHKGFIVLGAILILGAAEVGGIFWYRSATDRVRRDIENARQTLAGLRDDLAEAQSALEGAESQVAEAREERARLKTELSAALSGSSNSSSAFCQTREGHFPPEDAAQCVIYAWKVNDFSIVPDEMATAEVFTSLAAEPIDAGSLSFVGCAEEGQDETGLTRVECAFEPPDQNDTVQLYASGTPSLGYRIVEVGFYGNPPGWAPVD